MRPDPRVGLAQEAEEILKSMLPLLSFEAKLITSIETNNVRIQMECEDAGRLIGRKGSTVNEIQFLLNRILQRRHKTIPRIFLDVNGSREKEKAATVNEELIARVQALADKVRRWGEPVELGAMNAEDRKIIEELFAEDQEMEVAKLGLKEDSGLQKMVLQLKKKFWYFSSIFSA